MRVKYFYHWGYFYPPGSGADTVAMNHMTYFRDRGWEVDCILPAYKPKVWAAEAFRDRYPWLRSVTVSELPPHAWRLGDCLHAYDRFARLPGVREALAEPADLFFTNYVFTAPLLQHIPADCRRVLESVDIMSDQFPLAEEDSTCDPLAICLKKYRKEYNFQIEMDLYRMFDSVIMITREEAERVRQAGASHAMYVPRWCSVSPVTAAPPRMDYDLLYVASGNAINHHGIQWFYRHVYVRHLWRRGVRFAIAGGICDMLDFADRNVTLLGKIDGPLNPVYAASEIVVAPIFAGTGLSIKTVEALAMGKAVIAAPAAARGLDPDSGAFLVLDMKSDPKIVADTILRLLANPGERRRYEVAARDYAEQEFGQEKFVSAMDRALANAGIFPEYLQRLSAL